MCYTIVVSGHREEKTSPIHRPAAAIGEHLRLSACHFLFLIAAVMRGGHNPARRRKEGTLRGMELSCGSHRGGPRRSGEQLWDRTATRWLQCLRRVASRQGSGPARWRCGGAVPYTRPVLTIIRRSTEGMPGPGCRQGHAFADGAVR